MNNIVVRLAASLLACTLMFATFAGAASAQGYGNDPPERIQVGTGEVDFDGKFRATYTAPDEINEAYLIYVVGTDEDGNPFEWIAAQVTPGFAGLTWSLQGADMLPGSTYVLEARYNAGTDLGGTEVQGAQQTADGESDDAAAGTLTDENDGGSNTGTLVGAGIIATVLAGAGLYANRMRTRHA